MSIFKTLAVKDVAEATRAIPLIDVGPAFAAGRSRARGGGGRGAARLRDGRLLLPGRPRRAAGGDRLRLRGVARVPRAAARREARAQAQREQHRLPRREPEHAAALDGPQGDPAELQRELLHQPRPGRRAPGRRRRRAAPRPEPVARGARRDAGGDGRVLQGTGGPGRAAAPGARPRPRAAGGSLRAVLPERGAHQPPLPALPAPGHGRPGAVRARPPHRQLVHHDARARGGAGPRRPPPERRVAGAAGDPRDLSRESRERHEAVVERPLPLDAARRAERLGPGPVLDRVLLQPERRLRHRVPADVHERSRAGRAIRPPSTGTSSWSSTAPTTSTRRGTRAPTPRTEDR